MTISKHAMAIQYTGLRNQLVMELANKICDVTNGLSLSLHNPSERLLHGFIPELIHYGFGKIVFQTRTWKGIEPLVYEEIKSNSHFLELEGNMFQSKIPYFENERNFLWTTKETCYRNLENMLLAEITLQFPYLLTDERVAFFVEDVTRTLVENTVFDYFKQIPEVQMLETHFADNYLEVYFSRLKADSYTILINKSMAYYIQVLANKEEEMLNLRQIQRSPYQQPRFACDF